VYSLKIFLNVQVIITALLYYFDDYD